MQLKTLIAAAIVMCLAGEAFSMASALKRMSTERKHKKLSRLAANNRERQLMFALGTNWCGPGNQGKVMKTILFLSLEECRNNSSSATKHARV